MSELLEANDLQAEIDGKKSLNGLGLAIEKGHAAAILTADGSVG